MSDTLSTVEAMQEKSAEVADFMRLFSTPSRLMLMSHIALKERSVSEIQDDLGFRQPALSQQLGELRQAGVVKTRRESRQVYYSISDARVVIVMEMVMRMFLGANQMPGSILAPPTLIAPAPTLKARTGFVGEMAHWARIENLN